MDERNGEGIAPQEVTTAPGVERRDFLKTASAVAVAAGVAGASSQGGSVSAAPQTNRDAKAVLARGLTFDMTSVLERYQRDTKLPTDVVLEHALEIHRFLTLCSVFPGKYGMRGPMDELWHTFILFTEKYDNYCKLLGGAFIHHFPIPHTDSPNVQPDPGTTYLHFLQDYEKVFGIKPPGHLWPSPINVGHPSCTNCGVACNHKCVA